MKEDLNLYGNVWHIDRGVVIGELSADAHYQELNYANTAYAVANVCI